MKRWVDERLLGNFAFALRAIVEPPLSRLFYRSAHSPVSYTHLALPTNREV